MYDLPKQEYSSAKLAKVMKEIVGVELDQPPTIRKAYYKQFDQGFMKIRCESVEEYKSICEKIRYFKIDDKECRALGFDESIQQ